MELHGNSSRLRWGVGLGFLLEIKQGELGMLGMISDRTSLPLVMSLPGNWRHSKASNTKCNEKFCNKWLEFDCKIKVNCTISVSPMLKRQTTNLPFKLAVGPVPVSANGGGDVAAYTALWKEVQRRQILVIQKGVAVILVPHWHRGEELLTALWAGNAGSTGRQVPSGEDNRQLSIEPKPWNEFWNGANWPLFYIKWLKMASSLATSEWVGILFLFLSIFLGLIMSKSMAKTVGQVLLAY